MGTMNKGKIGQLVMATLVLAAITLGAMHLTRHVLSSTKELNIEKNEKVAVRSLHYLVADESYVAGGRAEWENTEITDAPKESVYWGYNVHLIPDKGIVAIPAQYGVTGIHTFYVDLEYAYYRKDLKGSILTALPTSPIEAGWHELP